MRVGTKLFLMFACTAVIILIVGITSLSSVYGLINSNEWVGHTKDVLQELDHLDYNLADSVSAQRGYIISGKEPFLDAYNRQVVATKESEDRLQKLLADNPEQLKRAKMLGEIVTERLASLETTCALFRAKGSEAAFDRIRNGKSLQFRLALQKQIEELKHTELALLQERDLEAKRDALSASLTVLIGMLLALAFLAVSNFLFGNTILTCIKQLITASENITYGRFDLSAQTSSNDEFADLAAAFNSMGQQLLLASGRLKEKEKECTEHQETSKQLNSENELLKSKVDSISKLSVSETSGLTNYKEQLNGLEQWFAKLAEMSLKFQDLERTSHGYVQRITFFNEGASRTASILQSELEFKQDVDSATLNRNFSSQLMGLSDLTQSIDKLISGMELIAMAAEVEASRTDTPDKAVGIFLGNLKEKMAEAKSTREQLQKHVNDLKCSTSEVLNRYEDVAQRLAGSRHNAAQIAQDLDKQTELCHELRIMFADSIIQKYVSFITGKRAFTEELRDDASHRDLRASQLSEIVSSTTIL